jgi:dihydroxyacid dehydratase/phosphogluconate dehydratase
VPQLCKVAPNTPKYHIEDVHRAGGVFGILGELDRAGLLDTTVPTVHSASLADALERWDVVRSDNDTLHTFFKAGPAGIPPRRPSARPRAGRRWTWTAPRAASARCSMRIRWKAAWPCCAATWPWMAAW